jgi:hypothetical protein
MHSKTGPVVESSKNLRIGCSTLYYPELSSQMRDSGLDPANNCWSDVHDFTPSEGNFKCQSGIILELPMMDKSGYLLPFTRITDPTLHSFRFRINEKEIDKLSELSTIDDVKLISVSRNEGLICIFEGDSRYNVERKIESLQPIPLES